MPETENASKEQVEQRVIEALVEFGEERENVSLGARFADLDVDSLDLVEVVKALEDRYEIQIADGRLKSIASVGDAVTTVQELVREKAGVSA